MVDETTLVHTQLWSVKFEVGFTVTAYISDSNTDLLVFLTDDPELFGYYLSENGTTFLPLPDCTDRFQLTLLGLDRHEVFTPQALIHVVRRGMEEMYADFYQAIADQDIVIPAFATDTYLVDKAVRHFLRYCLVHSSNISHLAELQRCSGFAG